MMSFEYIQFLKEKILQYLPQPHTIVGDKVNCRCFICGDSKKSATKKRGWIYLNKDCSYYCFNCGASLSGIKLLKLLSGYDYESIHREYVKLFLKSGFDSSLSASIWKPDLSDEPNVFNMKSILDPNLKQPLTDKARTYLSNRKVLNAPFLKEPLYSLHSKNTDEEYILIPWKVNGIDAYYQINDFLHLKSIKYIFPKGKKKLLYGLDNIDPSYDKIFVFEGVYDSLFVKNGIATGTKSITDYQLRLIKERWPHHQIVVAFDNDTPGFAAMKKMIELGKAFKFFVWFNQNTKEKDINELILANNNVNMFSSSNVLDNMIYDQLQMKLWLISNGKWLNERKQKKEILHKNTYINPLIKALSE